MEAIEELVQLSDSMRQAAAALLNDEDVDENSSSSSSRRGSTFLNVVALGNTGAGKSAVLNSLIGHPVLPTGEGSATRAPICIDLNRDENLSNKSIVLQIDSKSQPVSASSLRHSLQDRLGKISSKSRDEIYLKLETSTAPPLKLIDLPGVEKGNLDYSLSEYAQHNDAILLVVIPAAQAPEVSYAKALRIAKEYDGECTRTIGVISKVDQASADPKVLAACQALLLGQGPRSTTDITWVALIGQSVSTASAQSGSDNSLETAWLADSESLKSVLTGVPQSKLGRLALVETLAHQIRSRMKIRLPSLLSGSGTISDKNPQQIRDLINIAAENSQYSAHSEEWYDDTPRGVAAVRPSNVETQLSELTKMVMQLTKEKEPKQVNACGICLQTGHHTDQCPTLQEDVQVNAMDNGYQGQGYWQFNNNNQGFHRSNQMYQQRPPPLQYNQRPSHQMLTYRPDPLALPDPPQNSGNLEEIVKTFITNQSQFQQETWASIQNLERQMAQLASIVGKMEAHSKLSSQTEPNPRLSVNVITVQEKKSTECNEESRKAKEEESKNEEVNTP